MALSYLFTFFTIFVFWPMSSFVSLFYSNLSIIFALLYIYKTSIIFQLINQNSIEKLKELTFLFSRLLIVNLRVDVKLIFIVDWISHKQLFHTSYIHNQPKEYLWSFSCVTTLRISKIWSHRLVMDVKRIIFRWSIIVYLATQASVWRMCRRFSICLSKRR